MIEGKWFAPGTPIPEAAAIRRAVFDRGEDALDAMAWNVVVWQGDAPAATGRLWWQDGTFFIGDVAVLPNLRRGKLGDLTLRLLIYKAQTHAARELRLITPTAVMPFFARLGFKPDGAPADPQPMRLLGQDVCLDTCKGCKKDCPNRVK